MRQVKIALERVDPPPAFGSEPSQSDAPRARESRALVAKSQPVNNVSGVSWHLTAFPQKVMTTSSDTLAHAHTHVYALNLLAS